MAETLTVGVTVSGAGALISKSADVTKDTVIAQSFTIAAGVTNQQALVGFEQSSLGAVVIVVEPNVSGETLDGAVVLKTNSTSSPAHTKTFPATGGELVWTNRSPEANPFAATDVSTMYWTNPGTKVAKVTVRIAGTVTQ